MEFTGERYIPTLDSPEISYEHWHRYLYATRFSEGGTVLDIACGEGYGSYLLSLNAQTVMGVDVCQETINHAATKYIRDNLEFKVGPAGKIPVEGTEIFDLIVSFETIEHIRDDEQHAFMVEVKRLLKKDGLFILSTPNKLSYNDLPRYQNQFHVREFYVHEFKDFLRQYFPHVSLLGQKIYPVSYIWSPGTDEGQMREYRLNCTDSGFRPTDEEKEILYVLGLCSVVPIDVDTSVLVDLNETIFKERDGRIGDLEAGVRVRDARIGELSAQVANLEAAVGTRDARIGDLERVRREKEAYIQQIHAGHGWRLLTKYFTIRDRLLPQGTKGRLLAKNIFQTFLNAPDVFRRIRKTMIRKLVYLRNFRPVDRKKSFMIKALAHWENAARATVQCYRSALNHVLAGRHRERCSKRIGALEQYRTLAPTVLIVTHVRFYPPTAGNELRIFSLIKFLKKRGYQIAVMVNPLTENAPLDRERRRKIHEFVDYYEEVGDFNSDHFFSTGYIQPLTTEPILEARRQQEHAFCPDAVLWRTSELIKRFSPGVIIAEYIWTSRVLKLAPADTLRVIDLIDMFSSKAENVNRFGFDDALAISPDEEKAFLNRADLALAIHDTEAAAFRQLEPTCRVITAGVDFDVATLSDSSEQTHNLPVVLIVASNNPFNVRCVQEFIDQSWPIIREQVSQCTLRIVGKVCHSLVSPGPGLELIPYVADLTEAYRQATVVVNPVYAGTGLKVKSVEALGHGQALVSWPEGVAGIYLRTDTPYFVSNSWPEMAKEVVHILTDTKFRHSLRAKAREFALVNLSDEVVYRELANHLDSFCRPKPKKLWIRLLAYPVVIGYIRSRRALSMGALASKGAQKKPEQGIE